MLQKTISKIVTIEGNGLHTNNHCTVTLHPADINHGIVFQRVDLPKRPSIKAIANNAAEFNRNTVIKNDVMSVATLEHFMATFFLLGISNILVEITNEEMPILEGSAKLIYEALKDNIIEQNTEQQLFTITDRIICEDSQNSSKIEAFANEIGDDNLNIEVTIDFKEPVGRHTVAIVIPNHSNHIDFEKFSPIITARTFVFASELTFLLSHNLIKGGNINNALVFVDANLPQNIINELKTLFNCETLNVTPDGTFNNTPFRSSNEPAYHKTLDFIGDISLLGMRISGTIKAYKPGHSINAKFTKSLLNNIK